jgi:large subunit ribosomal protein L1
VEKDKIYPVEEAMELVKKTATTKFDSAIEIHVRVGIDPKKGEQQVRSTVVLPHGNGKTVKIAVFAEGDKAKEAKEAGADIVGDDELIASIKQSGKADFEVAVATPDMMKKMAVIAKVLGPTGIMPSPKNETITTNVKKAVEELKKGKVAFRNDDTANIHQSIGKASFDTQHLTDNFKSFMAAVEKAKPETSKGNFIKSVYIASSMGPGIKVDYKK